MIKKVLLGLVILGVIAFAIIGYGTYKVADEALKNKEPQLRQYIQLDEAAQEKYILENVNEFLVGIDIDKDGKPEDKEKLEKFKEINARPEVQKALAEFGRSFMATAITASENITKDLSPEVKEKYEKEAEQLDTRLDKYKNLVDAAEAAAK